jgi:methylthioribose-1-phosphate isomerase
MNVDGRHYRSIWLADDGWSVEIIDQTRLPHEFVIARLTTRDEAAVAIRDMLVRGAPLIGATAAYGMCLALRADASDAALDEAGRVLLATRPTAVNLRWGIERMTGAVRPIADPDERVAAAYRCAAVICDEDVEVNQALGRNGAALLRSALEKQPGMARVDVLTHCNAGWLATVDGGTALAPVYAAHDDGLPVHVWVDETRPRNQGASLTAWELLHHGVPHTVIADNAGGHLMQRALVDLVITGTDRTTAAGDVCNKIGTYLKALAAHDNGVPFYVALPGSTIDWTISDGVADVPIEQRDAREVSHATGRADDGSVVSVQLIPDESPVRNDAFDVTPARLVTGLITERGVCAASADGLAGLYPEHAESTQEPAC